MDAKQHLFYGMGLVAYAVADIDGKVQREEKEKLHAIIAEGINRIDADYDLADIIFQIVEKDKVDFETAYKWGMDAIKLGEQHLTPGMKWIFLDILQAVSEAFPGSDMEEAKLIARFSRELRQLGN